MLTLDDDLRIYGRTSASTAWLERLLPPMPSERAVPASVYNVAAQLLAVRGGRGRPSRFSAGSSGRRILADGPRRQAFRGAGVAAARKFRRGAGGHRTNDRARKDGAAVGSTLVVTIEEASAAERLEMFARTFGLTAREDELLGLLAVGGDTRTIARRMAVSELTVQDHLKSICDKTGAHDRVTVLSRALGTRRGPASEDRRSRTAIVLDQLATGPAKLSPYPRFIHILGRPMSARDEPADRRGHSRCHDQGRGPEAKGCQR